MILCISGCKRIDEIPPDNRLSIALPGWYAPEKNASIAAAVNQWNAKQPDNRIEVKILFGKRDHLEQKIAMAATRGGIADLVLVRNEWLGRLAKNGAIAELPKPLARKTRAAAISGLLGAIRKNDAVWAVPFDADAYVIWARKDLVGDLPDEMNREALYKLVEHAAAAGGTASPIAFAATRATTSALAFLPWYIAFGGELADPQQEPKFDPGPAKSALQWMRFLAAAHGKAEEMAALDQSKVFSGMAGGAFAITVGGTWERGMYTDSSPRADKIVALAIPGGTVLGGWSVALSPHASPGAAEFAAMLFSPEIQRLKLQENGLLPTNKNLLYDGWFAKSPDGAAFQSALKSGISLPFSDRTSAALEVLATLLTETFLETSTIDQAVQNAVQAFPKEPADPKN
jgi:ABC-type glycerol-3-phosphate transport system substrate-binding protein